MKNPIGGVHYEKEISLARIAGCHHRYDFGWLRLDAIVV
jgi:hypothetical protein